VRQVQRDAVDSLPVSRDEVNALSDRLFDAERAAAAGDL